MSSGVSNLSEKNEEATSSGDGRMMERLLFCAAGPDAKSELPLRGNKKKRKWESK